MSVIKAANERTIEEAAALLTEGGLVAMPTETVYGLAANALDGKAVARIFEAKGRPAFNPLIVHIADTKEADSYVEMNGQAKLLADHFWPGPLTMILPRMQGCKISDLVSAGLPTLAIRVPRHPVTRALIKAAAVPLAAPSANRSGSLSPTAPIHVAESIGENVDLILAAGPSEVGLESTVLDLSGSKPVILRPGAVTAEDLEDVLGTPVDDLSGQALDDTDQPKSPGMLLKHYAPDTPIRLNAVDIGDGEALLAFGSTKFMGMKSGGHVSDVLPDDWIKNLSEDGDLHEAASQLFALLKELDKVGANSIAVMAIPEAGLGIAMNDRLRRAAQAVKEEGLKAS